MHWQFGEMEFGEMKRNTTRPKTRRIGAIFACFYVARVWQRQLGFLVYIKLNIKTKARYCWSKRYVGPLSVCRLSSRQSEQTVAIRSRTPNVPVNPLSPTVDTCERYDTIRHDTIVEFNVSLTQKLSVISLIQHTKLKQTNSSASSLSTPPRRCSPHHIWRHPLAIHCQHRSSRDTM